MFCDEKSEPLLLRVSEIPSPSDFRKEMPSDANVTFTVADTDTEFGKVPAPARLRVQRAVYDQPNFDSTYGLCDPGPPRSPWGNIKHVVKKKWHRAARNTKCNRTTAYKSLVSWFPCVDWIRNYKVRENITSDIIAGLTVGVLNVPQGMAYAMLASCPPVTGLYTSIFPVLIYFFMGTSRQCSMGTFSIISMMTSKMVLSVVNSKYPGCDMNNMNNTNCSDAFEYHEGTKYREIEWLSIQTASMATLFIGIWQLILGLIGAGAAAVYFSDQLVQGFTCGAAFHVFTSQLKSVFKLPLKEQYGAFKIIKTYIKFFSIIDKSHGTTVVISAICIVILVAIKIGINDNRRIMRKIRVPLPAELIVVVFGTLASYLMDLEGQYHVYTVKNIPEGMPPPTLPGFSVADKIIGDTFSTAIVGLAITVTLGLLFATKHGYSIDASQEFNAQGIGNILGSFFQCFPSGASVARSAVQNDVGGRTQIVSLIQCSIVIIVVLALGRFLEPLPVACLGAIVMVSVLHLLAQVVQLHRLWKLSLMDWSIFFVVFFGVLILDVDLGLGIGVGWAILTIMLRLQKPKVGTLGRLPGTDIYKRIDVYKTALEVPGVKIIRVDAPIYFANSAYIKQRLYTLADLNNLIALWSASKPQRKVSMPAIEGENQENFAYTLNLKLELEDDEDESEDGRRGQGPVAISMEDLTNYPRSYMASEGILQDNEGDQDAPIKHIIIDCSEICFIDVTGVGFLKRCQTECQAIGVDLFLACSNKPVRDMLHVCGAGDYIKESHLFVTVHDAVLFAVNAQKFKPSFSASGLRSDVGGGYSNPAQLARTLSNLGVEDEVPEEIHEKKL